MTDIKVGSKWILNADHYEDCTKGNAYTVKEVVIDCVYFLDDVGDENEIWIGDFMDDFIPVQEEGSWNKITKQGYEDFKAEKELTTGQHELFKSLEHWDSKINSCEITLAKAKQERDRVVSQINSSLPEGYSIINHKEM